MDFKRHIAEIEKKIGYTFRDKSLLTQAFTRESFCNENNGRGVIYKSSEVLEFFGDSVLSTAIVGLMLEDKVKRYEHGIYTELDEGDFSNIRSKLSDKRNLSVSMARLGLQEYLIMGEGDAKLGIENEPSVMEDLFESIVGAVYIDSGKDMEVATRLVSKMLDMKAFISSEPPIQSYKNALQEYCSDKKRRLPAPVYKTVFESGPDHKKVYERACYIGEELIATGSGKNLKIADAAAAEKALSLLKKREKPEAAPSTEAISKLRALASSKKATSPEYRDLGETPRSSPSNPEYAVECRFMGKTATMVGASKQEARALAAAKLLEELTPKKEAAKHPERKKRPSTREEQKAALPIAKSEPRGKKATSHAAVPKKAPHYHKKRS